jgi:hypothetical protein
VDPGIHTKCLVSEAFHRHHARVRTWLLYAARWLHCVVSGVLFGTFTVLASRFKDHESWTSSLVSGLAAGLFFGLAFGWWSYRQSVRARERLGTLGPDAVRAAWKATRRGVAPQDPEVRAAVLGLIEDQRALLRRQRVLHWVLWPLMTALAVWLALTESPWWWLAVPLGGVLFVAGLVTPERLERRAQVLRQAPPADQVS